MLPVFPGIASARREVWLLQQLVLVKLSSAVAMFPLPSGFLVVTLLMLSSCCCNPAFGGKDEELLLWTRCKMVVIVVFSVFVRLAVDDICQYFYVTRNVTFAFNLWLWRSDILPPKDDR